MRSEIRLVNKTSHCYKYNVDDKVESTYNLSFADELGNISFVIPVSEADFVAAKVGDKFDLVIYTKAQ